MQQQDRDKAPFKRRLKMSTIKMSLFYASVFVVSVCLIATPRDVQAQADSPDLTVLSEAPDTPSTVPIETETLASPTTTTTNVPITPITTPEETTSTTAEATTSTTLETTTSTTSETTASTTPETTSSTAPETTSSTTTTSTTTFASTTSSVYPSSRPNKTAVAPVNFTRVDELYLAASSESEMIEKWTHMDKELTTGVRSVLKMIFPHIVSMSSDAKVSGNCSGAILKWILNLRNLRSWAVRMLDAIGKPSAGILEGSLTMFGNYRQCLAVRAPDEDEIEIVEEFREYFRGKYCILQVKPHLSKRQPFMNLNSTIESLNRRSASYKYYEKTVYNELTELAAAFQFVNIRADLCVPSLCSRDDLQRVADFLAKQLDMKARVLRCDVEPEDPSMILKLDKSHISYAFAAMLIAGLVIASTCADFAYNNLREKSSKNKKQSLLTSMSLYKSVSHIRNIQLDRIADSKPVFLYALRLMFVSWIFLVSFISEIDFQYLRNLLPLRDLIMEWPMQLIVNSSLAFEALIFITAFTYSYQNISSTTLKDLAKYCASKYSRLVPAIMILVAFTIIRPLLYANRSPIWHDFVDLQSQECKTNGFINIFFLQNLLNYSQICVPQTWLFCVELQLCLLTIPIVKALSKQFDTYHGKLRLNSMPVLILALLTIGGCIFNFHNVYTNKLPAAWLLTYADKRDKDQYFSLHLIRTWTHITTFAIGLFSGYLCRCKSIDTFSGRPYGRPLCNKLMLVTSFGLMVSLIFCLHTYSLQSNSHLLRPIFSALYASFAPLLWSISLALLLFYLTVPNAKNQYPIASQMFICNNNIIRFGRLSFLAYLLNPFVNSFVYAVQEVSIFSSPLMIFHLFNGNLTITFGLAFIMSLFVELPCRRAAKKVLIGSKRHTSNFDIISRQLDIMNRNEGPSHDSFQHQSKLAHQHQNIPLTTTKA